MVYLYFSALPQFFLEGKWGVISSVLLGVLNPMNPFLTSFLSGGFLVPHTSQQNPL